TRCMRRACWRSARRSEVFTVGFIPQTTPTVAVGKNRRSNGLRGEPIGKRQSDRRVSTDPLLAAIVAHCRRTGMAESTFGRRAVNDGKFVSRLRSGGRITTQTEDRVQSFIGDAPGREPTPPALGKQPLR